MSADTFHHPLVDSLALSCSAADTAPLIIPASVDDWEGSREPAFVRRACLFRKDDAEEAALIATNQSFVAAMKAGLEVPGDVLESLLVHRSIGRVRYELRVAEAALVVDRRFELVGEYLAFVSARAGDLEGWHPVDGLGAGDLSHAFPLWAFGGGQPVRAGVDSRTMTEGDAASSRVPDGGSEGVRS